MFGRECALGGRFLRDGVVVTGEPRVIVAELAAMLQIVTLRPGPDVERDRAKASKRGRREDQIANGGHVQGAPWFTAAHMAWLR